MQDLRHHKSPLDVDAAWRELERKMQPKKKRRIIIFWFLMAGLAGSVLVTAMLATSGPFYTIAGAKSVKGNDKSANTHPQPNTWAYKEEIIGIKGKEEQVPTYQPASNVQVRARVGDIATETDPVVMVKEEEEMKGSFVANQEEKEGLAFRERNEFMGRTMLFPLPTLLSGCEEREAESMPAIRFWTQPQNEETVWWLMAQGGSGVQYFNYKDVLGETGRVDRVKAIENPGSIYQGRLGLGREIGKRFFMSAGFTGLFASEQHTGIVVDTVVGFKENVLVSSYKDHEGSVIEEYGVVKTTTIRQTTKKRYPGVGSISLFLGLGKRWPVGKSLISLEAAYQQRIWAGMVGSGLDAQQKEVDFTGLYRLQSSSWLVDLSCSIPVYKSIRVQAGCLFNQTVMAVPAAYTRYNTAFSGQLGLTWTLN